MRLVHSGDSIFSNDVSFENTAGPIDFKTDRVYSGTIEGKEDAQTIKSQERVAFRGDSCM